MGPKYGIVGDSLGIDLPQAKPDEDSLLEEKSMASYAKTGEFKRIQDHFMERIAFYQTHLPNGAEMIEVPKGEDWYIANTLIKEFLSVINMYERAVEIVEDAAKDA